MPGGPAITLGGTVVSLDESGDLRIGSSTVPLVAGASPTIDGGYVAGVAFPSATASMPTEPYAGGSSRMVGEVCLLKVVAAVWVVARAVGSGL